MLFKKFKKTQCLGVDLGSHYIKFVHMEHSDNKNELLYYDKFERNENNFSELKKFIKDKKLSGLKTAICVDDESLRIRKVELPKMPETDMKEAVKWKMRDVVEGDIEDYVVRYSKLPQENPNAKQIDSVAYVMHKKKVQDTIQEIENIGLKPEYLEPSVVSLAASVEAVYPSDEEWVASIDIGSKNSLMIINGKGSFYFSRPLNGIKISEDQSDHEIFLHQLAAEIQNTIDTFSITFRVEQLSRILISGGGALKINLNEYLSTNLGIKTETLDTMKRFTTNKNSESALYSQAISLAEIKL